jgi:hypothetical protein
MVTGYRVVSSFSPYGKDGMHSYKNENRKDPYRL